MPDSQTEANVQLSNLTEADIPLLLDMLYALGKSDGVSQITTSKADILEHFFGKAPIAFARLICYGRQIAGFIIFSWKWASFTGKKEIYMQALYIMPPFRRQGLARSAMAALASIALANGCSRIEWYLVKDKAMSHDFYASIGAHLLEHMAIGRLSGRNLAELAQISPAAS
ncbi:GNAT family N-acetyltransferase [Shewanella sp. AS16]|uniref:GNAT family N-acetyltransferase n=1 Tax=Shewanella sp. AS16 TaxID=2907625 RepID=UPI001F2C2E33|nr:GNAT family N-acetyltransferase [Shewanella sp. AS16]MCE9687231.1 GNAT family N-acetyltransferase [Shewanella sp. AS16]